MTFYKKRYSAPKEYEAATKEDISVFREFKSYLAEHRDLIFSLLLLFIADQYVLNGALRNRLEAMLQKVVARVEGRMEAPNVAAATTAAKEA